ncbi:MAG: glycosyltransferase family 9 protein [Acidibrevibacterium sp.]|jgi:ADP-heptose:LPS heptosyltransferase|uniref:glycosyltransferase family 9 protein n=1 Tax=Acidibrevibacterium fodinaquatile TaxID=1969806 RepID=UPI0023A87DB1|nr:glycosyltransferase family 9 protein [Acidibrevibacterium fodinaquatile]MCA7121094.1 glycosyltransferase family 9 protein [Acidibrevibacterium fodinaquatile]
MRILFISANRIGDAVITTNVLDYLIRTYPEARITIACGGVAAGVFERMPNRERTIIFDKRRYDLHWLDLWRQVVGTHWDLVVDFRRSMTAYFLWARKRVLKPQRSLGRKHEQFAAALGIRPAPLPVVWVNDADRAHAAAFLPADRPVIGLGPTANWPPKAWPATHFAALFRRLVSEKLPGAVAAVFAGPGEAERAMAAPLLTLLPEAIDLRGQLSLPEAAACLQRCALYVGNDSGLMHLAAAAGVPTVGLCAATRDRAAEMAPAGRFADWALGESEDMSALTVETAFATALRLMADAATA